MIDTNLSTQENKYNKKTPYSLEAEQSILGGLLLYPESWDKVSDKIISSDFFHPKHQIIYEAMIQSINKNMPVDTITLSETLDQTGKLEDAGGMGYLTDLASSVAGIANIEAYTNIVQERSIQRQLISASSQITNTALNPDGLNGEELLNDAERIIFNIAKTRSKSQGPQNIRSILDHTVNKIDELFNTKNAITGLTTGFLDLDAMTSGLQQSDLVIVAARPSMGKTTFAMNLVENALFNTSKNIIVFSLEMPSEQLMMRMLSSLGRINQSKIRTGKLGEDDWPKLVSAVERIKNKPLFIDDSAGLSPMEMRSRIRRIAREQGEIGMIMVDYLQLMKIPNFDQGRTNEISEITRSLKAIAKEFNTPVVALSQLNRALEQRPNKRPVNADLRESGAIEQDADVIMFIYRDEVYNPDSDQKGISEIIIGKQRNGPIGTTRLAFIGQYTRFENLAHDNYDFPDE